VLSQPRHVRVMIYVLCNAPAWTAARKTSRSGAP
jgi:hypothetical protein